MTSAKTIYLEYVIISVILISGIVIILIFWFSLYMKYIIIEIKYSFRLLSFTKA